MLAEKELSERDYNQWKEEYKIASAAMYKREEKMGETANALEQGLELLGATAIEDKL